MSRLERALDPLMWVACFVAYRLIQVLPIRSRLFVALLPMAGFYGFHTPDVPWRWSERAR